jgi:ribosome-binding factor A
MGKSGRPTQWQERAWGLMARNPSRAGRIADQIQRDLAVLIRSEVKDPRIGMVTLTGVEVSNDYQHAKVFFTTLGDAAVLAKAQLGLDKASGFLRSQLAKGLGLRIVPELHFVHDESVERGARLSKLIDDAVDGLDVAGSMDGPH